MKVLEYLNDRHVNFNVLPHDDTFDSQHLAEAVHVSGRQVAKTVLLRMDHGYRYAVAILPASYVIDLAAIGEILGGAGWSWPPNTKSGNAAPIAKWEFYRRLDRCTVWKR